MQVYITLENFFLFSNFKNTFYKSKLINILHENFKLTI
jgi:hypothetical protein